MSKLASILNRVKIIFKLSGLLRQDQQRDILKLDGHVLPIAGSDAFEIFF